MNVCFDLQRVFSIYSRSAFNASWFVGINGEGAIKIVSINKIGLIWQNVDKMIKDGSKCLLKKG